MCNLFLHFSFGTWLFFIVLIYFNSLCIFIHTFYLTSSANIRETDSASVLFLIFIFVPPFLLNHTSWKIRTIQFRRFDFILKSFLSSFCRIWKFVTLIEFCHFLFEISAGTGRSWGASWWKWGRRPRTVSTPGGSSSIAGRLMLKWVNDFTKVSKIVIS